MIAGLRSLWAAPGASPPPPRRVWRDWAVLAAVVSFATLEAVLRTDLPWSLLSAIVVAALAPTLLWRRSHPLLMLAIAFGTMAAVGLLINGSIQLYSAAFFLLLPYSLVRWGTGRAITIGLGLLILNVALTARTSPSLSDVLGGIAVLLLTLIAGLALRYRATARLRELDQAKSVEREQLARDLHDTVAHHVSAIVIRAQAGLATADVNPDAATDALTVIEAEASRTLTEMRSMVRLLRHDEAADLTPSPSIADLDQLARPQQGGPTVAVQVTGDVDGIPPTVAAAIYRLVQESITNARRHAVQATRIDVLVDADDAQVSVSVRDDGAAGPTGPPGYGIRGMIERATLLGGTCQAGRVPGDGWQVTAVLPRVGWSA